MFVELLAELDTDTNPTQFYDRICEAICRLTTMRRAAIFMSDGKGRRVRAGGAHGTPFEPLAALRRGSCCLRSSRSDSTRACSASTD